MCLDAMVNVPADSADLCPVRAQVGATHGVWLIGELFVIDRSTSGIISHLVHFDSHSEIYPIRFLWRFIWPYPTEFSSSGLRGPTFPLTLLLPHSNNAVQHHQDVEYITPASSPFSASFRIRRTSPKPSREELRYVWKNVSHPGQTSRRVRKASLPSNSGLIRIVLQKNSRHFLRRPQGY